MTKRSGWPTETQVHNWFRANRQGMKKGVYNSLKKGRALGEKYTAGLIEMFLTPPDSSGAASTDLRHTQQVLRDFLYERGVHSPQTVSREGVEAQTCGPIESTPDRTAFVDYLRLGVSAIGAFVGAGRSVTHYVERCNSDADGDVDNAVKWIFIRVAQCMAPDGHRLHTEEALAMGSQYVHVPFETYTRQAKGWQRFNPWTVVYGRDDGIRLGVGIVLPLTESAYGDILEGRRATFELSAEDLTSPSPFVLIEACAERPDPEGQRDPNPTKALLMCLTLQVAAMSRCQELPAGTVVRILSYAGTTRNRDRLLEAGYKPTGKRMARNGFELVERRIPLRSLQADTFIDGALLLHFSALCDGPPPP